MSRKKGSKNRPKVETQCEEVKALPTKEEALQEVRKDEPVIA